MLRRIHIGNTFLKASSADIVKTLYRPALSESILYQRGTAYFSIEFLLSLMDVLVEFVYCGGMVHLVTSVELDEATVRSFVDGYLLSEHDAEMRLLSKLEKYIEDSHKLTPDEEARLDVLANMIAANRFLIKVAIAERGIYHEKIGVFTDRQGDSIAFYGSANETVNAFYNNYETLMVCPSWGETAMLAEEYRCHFNSLWSGKEAGVRVMDLPCAVENKIINAFQKSSSLEVAVEKLMQVRRRVKGSGANKHEIRDYQSLAIEKFINSDFRHLFAMATGTGKSFTAVKAIERMARIKKHLNVLLLVPLVDLQRQWERAVNEDLSIAHRIFKFGGCGKDCLRDYRLSTRTASSQHDSFVTIAICVYDTFFSKPKGEFKALYGATLVLVDEAHNLTMANVEELESESAYRLGLSATPQRFRQSETRRLHGLFLKDGEKPYSYTLEAAISDGYLSRYKYYPIAVGLTSEEKTRYSEYSVKIGKLIRMFDQDPSQETQRRMEDALMARSRIVKKAVNKISLLEKMVASCNYDFHNAVVFCGPGRVDLEDGGRGDRIIDLVTRTLASAVGKRYFPARYTSGEEDRPARLEDFRQGYTDTLVAIKCFDEGLDVPALDKIYIMASDSSLRQTIQRRGRVLRLSRDTGKDMAYVYDMVAGEYINGKFFPLPTELARIYEYSRISENPSDSECLLEGFVPSRDEGFDNIENYE